MYDLDIITKQTVLVVGDVMIDKYIIGSVDRISPEAPVPVLRQREVQRKIGGAGNVALNALSLGAKVRLVGRIGNDPEGNYFRQHIEKLGIDDKYIFIEGETIVKTRVSASNQQFLRIDKEKVIKPSEKALNRIRTGLQDLLNGVSVVIISDYAKGFISEEVSQIIIEGAKEKCIPVLVDPKGKEIKKYRGATAITPNNKEFLDLTGLSEIPEEDEIKRVSLKICDENDIDNLIFTRSEKGISVISKAICEKRDFPAVVKEVVDVTGAGDTVVATVALCLGAGFPLHVCAEISNVAASVVISKFGAAQPKLDELKSLLKETDEMIDIDTIIKQIQVLKKQGKRIVFTNGCFDLVHAGHISSFIQAKSFGDVLVVGVNSDESIRRIKGSNRPVVTLENRIRLLMAIKFIDYVIPFEEDTPQKLIEKICPDVLVKGKEWEGTEIAGAKFVKSYGGKVEFINLVQGLSTTSIIKKIHSMTI